MAVGRAGWRIGVRAIQPVLRPRCGRLARLRPAAAVVWLCVALACGGCVSAPATSGARARDRTRVYERARLRFERAAFFKPAADGPDGGARLAPLIVQQLGGASLPAPFGTVLPVGDGPFDVDTAAPAVYGGRSAVVLNGIDYEQTLHVWFYPPGTVCDGDAPCARGVRITYDSGGFPVIWELLPAGGEQRIVFVSRSLESAARDAVGPPLPGRRHAVEPSMDDHPNIIVPRILDDGPVPMGPFVYLDAPEQRVTTLICRCMPSQVDAFESNEYYERRDMDELISIGFPNNAATSPSHIWAHLADPPDRDDWLTQVLRLPARF